MTDPARPSALPPLPAGPAGRLLVLGAGPAQVPGILAAVRLGCRVVSVDNRPDNPGHRHAWRSFECDTRDLDGVLAIARRQAVDGIVSFRTDVALPAVAHVAAHLGLPGPAVEAVAVMTDKARFRTYQRQQGLPGPAFVSGGEPASLFRQATDLIWPIYVKPVDGQGSRGVTRLEERDAGRFAAACRLALGHSPARRVCVEEAVAGTEVGGAAFLEDGRLAFLAITRKYLAGPRVVGHRLPDDLPGDVRRRVGEALEAACAPLGYRSGPLNFDLLVDEAAATVLEMSPRSGGNGLVPLVRRATGIDLESAIIAAALGEPPAWPAADTPPRGCGVAVLGCPRAGRLAAVPDLDALRHRLPEVFAVDLMRTAGQPAEAFEHGGQAVAHVLFDCADEEHYARIAAALADDAGIRLTAEP